MKTLVTGCAGFVGSTLTDVLLSLGHEVIGVDNFTTGLPDFIDTARKNPRFEFFDIDLLTGDLTGLAKACSSAKIIFHLAANADIRGGTQNTAVDINQNILVTHRLLDMAQKSKSVDRFLFASTAAALGEPAIFPTPEDIAIPKQTSLYGASKLAGEGMLSAYANAFGIEGYAFRFVSVLGARYSHGHVYDFVKKLRRDPHTLEVLGDGTATKSYLNVQDCVNAILTVGLDKRPAQSMDHKFDVYNVGINDTIAVAQSAKLIAQRMRLTPRFVFGQTKRGWVGDNHFVHLNTGKLEKLGWSANWGIQESISQTVDWLQSNPWIFEKRKG